MYTDINSKNILMLQMLKNVINLYWNSPISLVDLKDGQKQHIIIN